MKKAILGSLLVMPLLMAGCSTGMPSKEDMNRPSTEYKVNWPISVTPDRAQDQIYVSSAGRPVVDQARINSFYADFARRGHGTIRVEGSAAAVRSAAFALVHAGASTSELSLNVDALYGGAKLSFLVFVARTRQCGNFTSSSARFGQDDPENTDTSDFGCTTQQNLAAEVVDPLDLERAHSHPQGVNAGFAADGADSYMKYRDPKEPTTAGITSN